jgi:hypothetical protein
MSQASFSPLIMPEPKPARIRPYKPSDEKPVRFMIGQAQMEALAYANNRSTFLFFSISFLYFFRAPSRADEPPPPVPAYLHPVTLAIWIAVSAMFAQYMRWWPNAEYGFLSWLRMLPAFFAPAVPIMFFIDW